MAQGEKQATPKAAFVFLAPLTRKASAKQTGSGEATAFRVKKWNGNEKGVCEAGDAEGGTGYAV